jgi:HK97 family phage major capsid protein
MLNEKGSQKWTALDQAVFDQLVNQADRAELLLEQMRADKGSPVAQWAGQRNELEQFIRNGTPALRTGAGARNAMSTTTPAEGGYTVGQLVAADMVSMLKGYGWMREVADQVTTTTGEDLNYPSSDGTAEVGELLAQNAAASSLDISFAARGLNTSKVGSKVFAVPVELLQDAAIDVVALIMQRSVERIGRTQNQLFTTGTGTGQPIGLVTASAVGKTGTAGQTATIIYDDLVDLADSVDDAHTGMPSRHASLPEAVPGWMFSQTMRKVIRKLKDADGRPIWTPSMAGERPQLLDYPVYINNDMPAPAASAKSLAFGNLRKYMIRDALRVTLMRFDDSGFAMAGKVGFLAHARAGGNLLDTSAVKTYQHSAS